MKKNWIKIMALAMSLPSSILGIAWILWELEKNGYITKIWSLIILIAVVFNTFVLMVYHANKK